MLPGIARPCQDFARFGNCRLLDRYPWLFQYGGAITRLLPMSKPLPMSQPRGCPICGKLAAERLRPFCSRRCADVDLGRWLTGSYAVPAEEDEEETADPKAPEDD
jgi:uncharacterized protein